MIWFDFQAFFKQIQAKKKIMETFNENDIRYKQAKKQVQKIKGFYIHAAVYVIVNAGLLLANSGFGKLNTENIMENLWMPLFWGIGLLIHGLSVFLPHFILGKDWEEKKIKEIMEKEKRTF